MVMRLRIVRDWKVEEAMTTWGSAWKRERIPEIRSAGEPALLPVFLLHL
jgi:hypothetical protein